MECLGLAAPQVNISLRAFVMCEFLGPYNPLNHAKKLVINPQIVRASKAQGQVEESCLSIPGQSFLVPREEHIEVQYTTASGYRVTEAIAGLEARVFQHEFDHLNGILLFQRGKVVSPWRDRNNEFEEECCREMKSIYSKWRRLASPALHIQSRFVQRSSCCISNFYACAVWTSSLGSMIYWELSSFQHTYSTTKLHTDISSKLAYHLTYI